MKSAACPHLASGPQGAIAQVMQAATIPAEYPGARKNNAVRVVRDNPDSSAQELMGLLMRAVSQHCAENFQDDASVIVLKGI
jgi:hypothetical protein